MFAMIELVAWGLLVAFALLVRKIATASEPAASGSRLLWIVAFSGLLGLWVWVEGGSFPMSLILLALLLAMPGSLRARPRLPVPRFLEGPQTLAAGVLTTLIVAFAWAYLRPVPLINDESAYLLQARIFASGHWIGAGRPLPEFFEQTYVLVTPVLASKYPPGHSLLMVPGIWLGLPSMAPLILNGLAGSLVFAHARRLAGGAVALVTWLLWVSDPGTLCYRASYLSQTTTTVLWLLALWALREWWQNGGWRWIAVVALCLGWGAITRPLTMLALGVPIGCVILAGIWRRREWRELVPALVIGLACLSIYPMWNARVTGDWRLSSYQLYEQTYSPYDWIGFGVSQDPALRPLPKFMEAFDRQYRRIHAEHTVQALPQTLYRRLEAIARDQWGRGREWIGLFVVPGVLGFDGAAVFALASSACLVLGYLAFGHSAGWTPYYLEIQPVLSFATALGLCGSLALCFAWLSERPAPSRARRLVPVASAVFFAALFWIGAADVVATRGRRRADLAELAAFRAAAQALPGERLIVFVRYAPDAPHPGLVSTEPDLDSARLWIVNDLGDRDQALARLAPGRRLYLYDEPQKRFVPLERSSS